MGVEKSIVHSFEKKYMRPRLSTMDYQTMDLIAFHAIKTNSSASPLPSVHEQSHQVFPQLTSV